MTDSVANWRRQRERMQALLETLAKRKPGPETLRTQLRLMLAAYAATGLDIDELLHLLLGRVSAPTTAQHRDCSACMECGKSAPKPLTLSLA